MPSCFSIYLLCVCLWPMSSRHDLLKQRVSFTNIACSLLQVINIATLISLLLWRTYCQPYAGRNILMGYSSDANILAQEHSMQNCNFHSLPTATVAPENIFTKPTEETFIPCAGLECVTQLVTRQQCQFIFHSAKQILKYYYLYSQTQALSIFLPKENT